DPPGGGTPTGAVTFMDGTTTLGSGTLSGGSATYSTAALAVGTHTITVVYGGDVNFTGTTSAGVNQVVNRDAPATPPTSSATPSLYGQQVTFTAVITPAAPGAGAPTGTVNFVDGTTVIGSGTLANGTTSFTTSTLVLGSHPITAVYGGDSSFSGSTSPSL